jgi:hypothetical protein
MRPGRLGLPSALSDDARWHQFDNASKVVSPTVSFAVVWRLLVRHDFVYTGDQVSDNLHILAARISVPSPVSEEDSARHVRERLHVSIELENASSVPLHVWSSRRAFAFNPAKGVLALDLAEPDRELPTGIEMISDHPRVPFQIIVEPGGTATIDVPVPTTIRRRVPGEGLGMSFVEESIENVRKLDLRIQYADVPFQQIIGESPSDMRDRLREHGTVVHKIVSITT